MGIALSDSQKKDAIKEVADIVEERLGAIADWEEQVSGNKDSEVVRERISIHRIRIDEAMEVARKVLYISEGDIMAEVERRMVETMERTEESVLRKRARETVGELMGKGRGPASI